MDGMGTSSFVSHVTLKHVGDGIVNFNILKGTDISTYCFLTKHVEFQYVADFFGRDIQHTTVFPSVACDHSIFGNSRLLVNE